MRTTRALTDCQLVSSIVIFRGATALRRSYGRLGWTLREVEFRQEAGQGSESHEVAVVDGVEWGHATRTLLFDRSHALVHVEWMVVHAVLKRRSAHGGVSGKSVVSPENEVSRTGFGGTWRKRTMRLAQRRRLKREVRGSKGGIHPCDS